MLIGSVLDTIIQVEAGSVSLSDIGCNLVVFLRFYFILHPPNCIGCLEIGCLRTPALRLNQTGPEDLRSSLLLVTELGFCTVLAAGVDFCRSLLRMKVQVFAGLKLQGEMPCRFLGFLPSCGMVVLICDHHRDLSDESKVGDMFVLLSTS